MSAHFVLKSLRNNNLNKHLGIEFIELGEDYIVARMPVEDFSRQSRGILHGGASCVLAEALGSIASNMCIDMRKQKVLADQSALRNVSFFVGLISTLTFLINVIK